MFWEESLASSRLGVELSRVSLTTGGEQTSALLTCPAPSGSSAAIANLVLQEFSASARPSKLGLSRRIQIEILKGSEQQAQADAVVPQLSIKFTVAGTDKETTELVKAVASTFEAHLQYHVKAAKSNIHTAIRQRLLALRHQLLIPRQDQIDNYTASV